MTSPVSASTAIELVQSGMNVFIHGACATPTELIDALAARTDLNDVRTYHIHLGGPVAIGQSDNSGVRPISLFTGATLRESVNAGRADHVPIFLSDIPPLFESRNVPLDVAIVQVSPPDRHGICSLGTSVDCARAAVDSAQKVIGVINPQVPRTHGNTSVRIDRFSAIVELDRPLIVHESKPASHVEQDIAAHIAELVVDGATLQLGIGAIPDEVAKRLTGKSDLGVHTEMFSDGVVDLFASGAITNAKKKAHPGRFLTSFVTGTQRVFDFVNDNPIVEFQGCDHTNDTSLIRKNDDAVSINSAIQIDLSGQVCADSMGYSIFSGIGGQMDFMRGAALSKRGKPILALPSTAARGTVSRIVMALSEGAGVVTTRGHVHWVVTEYGAVNLHGKSLRERADMLIAIAHPDFRADLRAEVSARRHF